MAQAARKLPADEFFRCRPTCCSSIDCSSASTRCSRGSTSTSTTPPSSGRSWRSLPRPPQRPRQPPEKKSAHPERAQRDRKRDLPRLGRLHGQERLGRRQDDEVELLLRRRTPRGIVDERAIAPRELRKRAGRSGRVRAAPRAACRRPRRPGLAPRAPRAPDLSSTRRPRRVIHLGWSRGPPSRSRA